jgi:hypothetical protein
VGKTFGIVTDAEKWYFFLECSFNDQDRLRLKLLKPVIVMYGNEDMERNVERIIGHVWKRHSIMIATRFIMLLINVSKYIISHLANNC